MKLFIERENRTKSIKIEKTTVKELLKKLGINSSSVLVVRNSELITEDEVLSDKDSIKILSVVSGG